ncbi:MAG: hypothetical protein ACK4WH_08255 [Phycisphaerales bacterium]
MTSQGGMGGFGHGGVPPVAVQLTVWSQHLELNPANVYVIVQFAATVYDQICWYWQKNFV